MFGSIPAYAGEPSSVILFAEFKRVYPRVCGGTIRPVFTESCKLGSIPAYAGEPLVANLLILLVFKEQGDEGHPLTSLQEQNAVRIDNLFRRLAEGFDSQVS